MERHMDKFESYSELVKKNCRMAKVMLDEPMSAHTSFQIGGPARVMVVPETVQDVSFAVGTAKEMELDTLVIGKGTNLLVTDSPLYKVVIKLYGGLDDIGSVDDETIYAQSGAPLSRIAVFAMNSALTGFEFAHGIPGTLGGAVSMNAGAYGGEMKDVVVKTTYLGADGQVRTIEGARHNFGYRRSCFSGTDDIILSSEMKLSKGNMLAIMLKMKELAAKRRSSQPLDMPSAGSTFKRPATGYAAALIEEAGLKGQGFGGACVSEKHAGFVINRGGATFDDVLKTMELIQKTVYEKFGVELEPEVKIIR